MIHQAPLRCDCEGEPNHNDDTCKYPYPQPAAVAPASSGGENPASSSGGDINQTLNEIL
jgi:hypothetical protein